MKKKFIALILAAALMSSVCISAHAGTNAILSKPQLRFESNTAKCYMSISGNNTAIEATMTLKYGSTVIAIWHDSGDDSLVFDKRCAVTGGRTYTLTVSGTFDGAAFTPGSTSA